MERFIRNPIIRQLMLPSLNQSTFIRVINNLDDGINDVITDSMDRDEKKTPMCKDFRSNLTIRKISKKDLDEEISCAICQDLFSNNEEIIELPCKGAPHFFHLKNDGECPGIDPWMDEKNTCPVCRTVFPSEPEPEPGPEPEPEPEPELEESENSWAPGIDPPINTQLNNRSRRDISIQSGLFQISPMNLSGGNRIQNIITETIEQVYQEIENEDINEAIKRSLEDVD